uniref:Uncharacterized protein n=1 Tax=Romanomermis culicivorax TaxID=13658 RepID=A0A915J668_ROMCU
MLIRSVQFIRQMCNTKPIERNMTCLNSKQMSVVYVYYQTEISLAYTELASYPYLSKERKYVPRPRTRIYTDVEATYIMGLACKPMSLTINNINDESSIMMYIIAIEVAKKRTIMMLYTNGKQPSAKSKLGNRKNTSIQRRSVSEQAMAQPYGKKCVRRHGYQKEVWGTGLLRDLQCIAKELALT